MLDPYRMVTMNIIAFTALILAFLSYKYVFPRKTPPYLLIVFMFSLLPLISILRVGSYESGDLSLHAMRLVSFYRILIEENIRPVWTPEFNAGYGDPHFLFSYFLPYFLASILHKIGLSLVFSMKTLLAIFYILSGLFMYIWVKNELGEKSASVAAIFFLFTPYHLLDMHFRVTIAESMSFAFLPLCMYLASKIIKILSVYSVFLLGLSIMFLILTHQIISLFFMPIFITYSGLLYLLKRKRSKKEIYYIALSILIGFGLSCFYWLPIIAESKFTQASLSKSVESFVSFPELLFSPWRYGFLFQGHSGELSFLIGYTQVLVLLLSSFLVFKIKGKKIKFTAIYFLIISFSCIFLILPYSEFLWRNIPLLNYFQYSYRLLTFVTLSISFLAGIIVLKLTNKLFFISIILITILYTILNWGNRRALPEINDFSIKREFTIRPDVGNYLEPSSPIWTNVKYKFLRKNNKKHIDLINGQAEIKEIYRNSTIHQYLIMVESDQAIIKENTLYFPGWIIKVNGQKKDTTYNSAGVIQFKLDKGLQKVDLKFEDTIDRKIGKYISIITVVFIFVTSLFVLKKRRQ